MAIHESKKQSDLEKRLKLLRRQVHGQSSLPSKWSNDQKPTTTNDPVKTDAFYLRKDLLKILVLSTFAIGAQILLFTLVNKQILNLNFF